MTSLATKEMKKFAYDLVDRTILSGLGKAASSADKQTAGDINFYTDLMAYLQEISPYSPTQDVAEELSDRNGWGSRTDVKTYLDYACEYFGKQSVGENQMYDRMTVAVSDAAAPLIHYLTAYCRAEHRAAF